MNNKNLENQKVKEKSNENQIPSWISPFSWIGSVIFASMIFLILICGAPELNLAIILFLTIFYFLIAKIILYIIPFAIFKIWKIIKSGSGKILDSAITSTTKKIVVAIDQEREKAKNMSAEEEELNELKKRIAELEGKLSKKEK